MNIGSTKALVPRSNLPDSTNPELAARATRLGVYAAENSRRWLGLPLVVLLYSATILLFAVFHPVLEWPDAETHLTEACNGEAKYPPRWLLQAFDQDLCSLTFVNPLGSAATFFSDRALYSDLHAINPGWLYVVLPLMSLLLMWLFIAGLGDRDVVRSEFVFAPPLAFYFANINPEIFGLFVVVGAYFIFKPYPKTAIFLTFLAVLIDRSHVCSFLTFLSFYFLGRTKRPVLLPMFVGGVLILYVARLMGALDILDWLAILFDSTSILGLTGDDIYFNAGFGGRGYAALFASSAGLYGSMMFRPFLWPAYYVVFFSLLVIGFARSETNERVFLMLSISAALAVLIILPPLSQARYYPILIVGMWSMMIRGGRWIGISPSTLQIFFFLWTATSIFQADLAHIVQG